MTTTLLIWALDGDLSEDLQEQVSDVAYRLVLGTKSPLYDGFLVNKTQSIIKNKLNDELRIIISEMNDMVKGSSISSMVVSGFEKDEGKLSIIFDLVTSDNVSKSVKIEI